MCCVCCGCVCAPLSYECVHLCECVSVFSVVSSPRSGMYLSAFNHFALLKVKLDHRRNSCYIRKAKLRVIMTLLLLLLNNARLVMKVGCLAHDVLWTTL